jgi:hypothetical protein
VAVAPSRARSRPRPTVTWDPRAAWIWALTLALILYLGFDGGGYDLVVRSEAGIVIWWVLLLGALLGFRPPGRLARAATVALALFALFAAWSTLSTTWSLSSERSLDEASRLAAYLGILWLALVSFGTRERALRHVVGAVAVGIVVIAAMSVLTRLAPNLIPAAQTTGQILPGSRARLSWPLNYWNALGALVAMCSPLLLTLAVSARALWARSAAAAAVPLLMLCGYLTFSRGAAVAAGAALVVFIALSPQRIPRVATALLCAGGGVILIASAVTRHAIENGLTTSAASSQGGPLLVLVIVVCLAVGVLQALGTIAARRVAPASLLAVPLRPARAATVICAVLGIVVAVAVGVPNRLDHAWQGFKSTTGANLGVDQLSRFTALSGNGRYTYWKTAIDAMPGHWLAGYGVGTFQLVWLPRAPFLSYVINAHSLYVETLTEVGIVGLLALLAFLATLLVSGLRRLAVADPALRGLTAAVVAAGVSFMVSAAFDWIWQVPVLPAAFLLLGATSLATDTRVARSAARPVWIALRAGTAVVAVVCLILIGVPMAMTQAVRASQADVKAGHTAAALTAARTAMNIEPGAESPAIQAALVLELQGRFAAAVTDAGRATSDEPQNWNAWLIRSRLEAESGHAALAVAAFDRARSLNPRSPLFAGVSG